MNITEVRITLVVVGSSGRLRAFCSVVIDYSFVIQELKIIDGKRGLFVAMPSKMINKHCNSCGQSNKFTANFCNNCGEEFHQVEISGKELHMDVAFPIESKTREYMTREILNKYREVVYRNVV